MKQLAICSVLCAAVCAAHTIARAGACARAGWSPKVLTPKQLVIPRDGGLLVGAVMGFGSGSTRSGNPSLTNWHLHRGGRIVRLRHKVLAPGLTVYRPRKRVIGIWWLTPRKNKRSLRFGGRAGRSMAAPTVKKVETYMSTWKNFRGYTQHSQHVDARITGAAPKGAIGVIVYKRFDHKWVPMLFRRVPNVQAQQRGARNIGLYSSPGRCSGVVPGLQIPVDGHTVQLRWVDQFGRLSKASNMVKVTRR